MSTREYSIISENVKEGMSFKLPRVEAGTVALRVVGGEEKGTRSLGV
jgi:hypothetical protein